MALKISAHHGHIDYPNNLKRALDVIDKNNTPDIIEIDFVSFGDSIISSHDYDIDVINCGNILEDWIMEMVVHRGKILWIDVKENLFIHFNCMYSKFDVPLLFRILQLVRRSVFQDKKLNITPFIWIGCQDKDLFNSLIQENDTMKHPWKMILDMPTVSSYIYQYLTPNCFNHLLEDMVIEEFRNKPVRQYDVIAIDQSFFYSLSSMTKFIKTLKLRPDTHVILNSFSNHEEAPVIKNINIIMQYDYR